MANWSTGFCVGALAMFFAMYFAGNGVGSPVDEIRILGNVVASQLDTKDQTGQGRGEDEVLSSVAVEPPVDEIEDSVDEVYIPLDEIEIIEIPAETVNESNGSVEIDWEAYNYDYVDEDVKGILNEMLGADGKTAFYLPEVGYVNVSRGAEYGIAYALNNPEPSGENYFEFNWTVDSDVVADCGVEVDVAQEWIVRGGKSWGNIRENWIDHMTIYFSFPDDVEACSVAYDFVVVKDGDDYGMKSVLFNLV